MTETNQSGTGQSEAGIDPHKVHATLIEYSPDYLNEVVFEQVDQALAYQPHEGAVRWLNVYGLHDLEVLQEIGNRFHLHPLVIEDIHSAKQRPKLEDYGDYLFFVGRVFHYTATLQRLMSDQIYLIIGKSFVISFQARQQGLFQQLRDRLKLGNCLLRQRGSDFLAYSLIDMIMDRYFGIIDEFNERVEAADTSLLNRRDNGVLRRIHRLKHDSLKLRRALLPLRDALAQLTRGDHEYFSRETQVYMRDAYDHALHLIESLESARDMVSGMLDMYLSSQSNRLNIQMRILTVITIIFMPLTLISSIYGMNFDNMPELHWQYGYFIILGVMASIAGGLCWLFWRRKWL